MDCIGDILYDYAQQMSGDRIAMLLDAACAVAGINFALLLAGTVRFMRVQKARWPADRAWIFAGSNVVGCWDSRHASLRDIRHS